MKDEKMFDAVTGIRDDIIDRAAETKLKKRLPAWKKWTAAAACLAIVAGGVLLAARFDLLPRLGGGAAQSGSGGGEGETYMRYTGPVFPLTALGDASALAAERDINFDFSPYKTETVYYDNNGEERSYETWGSEVMVTDGYALTNTSDEDVTLTAVYPFAGSFSDKSACRPAITVNGAAAETELYAGPYSGGFQGAWGTDDPSNPGTLNLDQLDSWLGYKAIVGAGYMDGAFDEFPALDQPVTVYEISDRAAPTDTEATNPTLNMEFYIDYDKTRILSYGMSSGSQDIETGYCARGTHVPESFNPDYGESAYVIVLGDDIGDYTLKGYSNGSCDEDAAMEGVTAVVTRYESTLGQMMEKIADRFTGTYFENRSDDGFTDGTILGGVSREMYLGAVAEMMYDWGPFSEDAAQRYDSGMLEDFLSETASMQRIMYLAFDVTVPAGGTVQVNAAMTKEASMDFLGDKKDRNGYDMVTRLGSVLNFTAQTASVRGMEYVEIAGQNFGFDPAAGVTSVPLDMTVEHYWIEVRKQK